MATAGTCAKCNQDRVLVVPATSVGIGYARAAASQVNVGFFAGGAPIDLHVCMSCGYVEHWADTSHENFRRLSEKFGEGE